MTGARLSPAKIQVSTICPHRNFFLVAIFPEAWIFGPVRAVPSCLIHRIGLN